MAAAPLTLGVIGLGSMGEAVARRLVRAGFPLMVFDLASGPVRYFVMKNQADIALSPRMMAETCDAVLTVLPSAEAVRTTVFGKDGLAQGFRPGGALIDLGTSGAAASRTLAAELAERNIAFLEAPVCGSPVDAKAGRLTIPVAGEADVVDRFMPVFQALAEKVTHTGPIGSGAMMAALADYVRSATALAAGEALLVAGRVGLAPAAVLEFCATQGVIGPAVTDAIRPRDVPRSIAAAHTLGTIVDDLDATLTLADEAGVTLRFAALCREIWAAARQDRGTEDDHAAIVRWLDLTAPAAPAEPDDA